MDKYYLNEQQKDAVTNLEKQGFLFQDNGTIGMEFKRLNSDNFVEKMVVTKSGKTMRYKPTEATKHELRSLRK